MLSRPDRSEAAPYYFKYIDLVPDGDIRSILNAQTGDVLRALAGISEDQSVLRYAPDKWSIREVLGHVNDTERLFISRAFWFARGFDTPLPSFDQHVAAAAAGAHERTWQSLVEEFGSVRRATMTFFEHLRDEDWSRRGIASDNPFSVRALAYITAGHVMHHMNIVQARYLDTGSTPDP